MPIRRGWPCAGIDPVLALDQDGKLERHAWATVGPAIVLGRLIKDRYSEGHEQD
jgi:hypothetical protein